MALHPSKLRPGDRVRVIAPARSLLMISADVREIAQGRFAELGLELSFGRHVDESDPFVSTSVEARVEDLHAAFRDSTVQAVLTAIGGFNSNQLLGSLDWELIRGHPKIFCGFSDITALGNAILARTGLVTYSGPHYSTFGQKLHFQYTLECFRKCLFSEEPFAVRPSQEWTDDRWFLDQDRREPLPNAGWFAIQPGEATGTIVGGNLCTLNLLQGTPYMPDLEGAIVFVEDDLESNPERFDRDLQSLLHQPAFAGTRGLVIGRFQKASRMTREKLVQIVRTKRELFELPVLAEVDFGHTSPILTFPIGGRARLVARDGASELEILAH